MSYDARDIKQPSNPIRASDDDTNVMLWTDIETTGLNVHSDAIIEVHMELTDFDLTPLAEPLDLAVRPDDWETVRKAMPERVRTMHTANGLVHLLDEGDATTPTEAGRRIGAYVREARRHGIPVIAGASVHFDRSFLMGRYPTAMRPASHRLVDVSTIDLVARAMAPDVFAARPAPTTNHRAARCVEQEKALYSYYQPRLFAAAEVSR